MSHAVEGDGKWHARIQQVRQLLGKCGQLLKLWSSLPGKSCANRWRQECFPIRLLAGSGAFGCGKNRAAFGSIDRDGKQPESLDLDQRGRTIGDVEHSLDHFTGAPAGLI